MARFDRVARDHGREPSPGMIFPMRSLSWWLLASAAVAQPPPADLVWVHANNLVRAFDLAGNPAATSAPVLPGGGYGIAIDGLRRTWVTNFSPGSDTVSCFDVQGGLVGTFSAGPAVAPNETSAGPVAIDAAGTVYVGDPRDTVPGTVTRLTPAGMPAGSFAVSGESVRQIAVDPNGDLWVLVFQNTAPAGHVQKYTSAGAFLLSVATGGTAGAPSGLYADEWGRITVSGDGPAQRTVSYDLSGNQLGTLTTPSPQQGVAVAPDGHVWITEVGTVRVFDSAGVFLGSLGTGTSAISSVGFDHQSGGWISTYPPVFPIGSGQLRLRKASPVAAQLADIALGAPSANGPSFNIGDMTGLVRARTVDPTGDLDGDGHPNYAEVVAGTSPFDVNSLPTSTGFLTLPVVGTQLRLAISAAGGAGRPWFFPWSANGASFPLSVLTPSDPRTFPLSPIAAANPAALDPIWNLSVGPTPFTAAIFPDTFGVLDASGAGTVRVNIPPIAALLGLSITGAFCTLDAAAPSGIRSISFAVPVTFQ